MSDTGRLKRMRRRLWIFDPHCRKCGRVTILPEHLALLTGQVLAKKLKLSVDLQEIMATLDHKFSRYDPRRREGGLMQLLCWRCNNDRGSQDTRAVPIEELWRRANAYPLNHPLHDEERGNAKPVDGEPDKRKE